MFDTHAHLDDRKFDPDREEVIRQAFSAGLKILINIGTDVQTSRFSVQLSQKYPQIYATVAVHPHAAKEFTTRTVSELEELAKNQKVVAIGEIGLDYYRMYSPKEAQIRAFKSQIELAFKLQLPVVYHVREAFDDTWKMITETKAYQLGGVMHSFSGDAEQARKVTDVGLHLSFNGTLTYKNSMAQKVLPSIPQNLILSETDCPYLTPVPHRGERNRPEFVQFVLEKMSEILGKSYDEIVNLTTQNARKLFRLETQT